MQSYSYTHVCLAAYCCSSICVNHEPYCLFFRTEPEHGVHVCKPDQEPDMELNVHNVTDHNDSTSDSDMDGIHSDYDPDMVSFNMQLYYNTA